MNAPVRTIRPQERLIDMKEVVARTSLNRRTIYRKMDGGLFPRSIPITTARNAWYESDVAAWIADPLGWPSQAGAR